jgi:cell division protein FtsA
MPKQNAPIVGLDIGTSYVRVVVAELLDGQLDIVGVGEAESKGLRKGMITKPELIVDSIRRAVEDAERMSGLTVSHVYVGLAGANLEGQNSQGKIAIAGRHREIIREDIARVIEQACVIQLQPGREIADYLPQEYTVDGQEGIDDPLGWLGTRLEVSVHIITSPVAAKQNLITSINRAGYAVSGIYLSHIAAAEAVLSDDDKEYGVAVVNIGGETTSLAIYQGGSVWHTAVIPLGGNHFTSDIAIGLRTPIPAAERIKREYGCAHLALLTPEDVSAPISVPSVGGREPRPVSRQLLHDIIKARAEEIMEKVHEHIVGKEFERRLSSGIVLTGGGALLDGVIEVAEEVLRGPARLGMPGDFSGLSDEIGSPSFSAAAGLALHGMRIELGLTGGRRGLLRRPSVTPIRERVKSFFGIKR